MFENKFFFFYFALIYIFVVVVVKDKVAVVHEHAEAVVETAWRLHTDAPILAEIDHAIATRAVGDGKAMGEG